MKVTTQQTSKPIKLLITIGAIGILFGIIAMMAQKKWALLPFVGGVVLLMVGRVLKWWHHD